MAEIRRFCSGRGGPKHQPTVNANASLTCGTGSTFLIFNAFFRSEARLHPPPCSAHHDPRPPRVAGPGAGLPPARRPRPAHLLPARRVLPGPRARLGAGLWRRQRRMADLGASPRSLLHATDPERNGATSCALRCIPPSSPPPTAPPTPSPRPSTSRPRAARGCCSPLQRRCRPSSRRASTCPRSPSPSGCTAPTIPRRGSPYVFPPLAYLHGRSDFSSACSCPCPSSVPGSSSAR
jgi:hypothetical protein